MKIRHLHHDWKKKKKHWPFTVKFDRIMQMIILWEWSLTPNFVQLWLMATNVHTVFAEFET